VLSGAAWGSAFGALAALGAWALRLGELRPVTLGFGVAGALIGGVVAARQRWTESEVALYLDARLAGAETVTTALHAEAEVTPALAFVVGRATHLLGKADPKRLSPRVLSRVHALLPVALGAIVWVSILPLPPAPPAPPQAPGAERVKLDHLQGLERIEALEHLPGRTPEQDARLKALAEQARKLRADLAKGLEKREALSEISKLRDGIAAEQLKLGDQQNRAGLDAALGAFGKNQALRSAQKALGDGDLTAFDDEMQKLAKRVETSDREAAKEALEEAAKAAREKGAKGLADALDAERRLFGKREDQSQALRELAESMKGKLSPEALEDLKEFGRSGDPKAERQLNEALEKALEGLSPEERKRLAERLQKQLEAGGDSANPLSKKQLEALAKKLSGPEGADALREQLRELTKPLPSDDAQREQGLGDAERGGRDAARGLGALPMPSDDGGPSSGGPPGKSGKSGDAGKPGSGGDASGKGGTGTHHDSGQGDHAGSTPEVKSKELRAKADARMLPGAPMQGATLGRAPARAGETANQLGTGTLGSVGQTEVGAVDHSDIPEEYREQVGRYFEP